MKLAVLADVHGNLTALETVIEDIERWRPDRVIVAGDLINRGPRSADCLACIEGYIKTEGWIPLKGNHEDYVIAQSKPDSPREGPLAEIFLSTNWTFNQLDGEIGGIAAWKNSYEIVTQDRAVLRFAHASMLGNQSGIFPFTPSNELIRKIGYPAPDVFCCGHTHTPLKTRYDHTLVVNIGSVGLPFDGDTRAGYARLWSTAQGWEADIVRLDYDRQQALEDNINTGYLVDGGPLTWLVFAEFLFAGSQLFQWHRDFFEAVTSGILPLDESARLQLESQGLWDEIEAHLTV